MGVEHGAIAEPGEHVVGSDVGVLCHRVAEHREVACHVTELVAAPGVDFGGQVATCDASHRRAEARQAVEQAVAEVEERDGERAERAAQAQNQQ